MKTEFNLVWLVKKERQQNPGVVKLLQNNEQNADSDVFNIGYCLTTVMVLTLLYFGEIIV